MADQPVEQTPAAWVRALGMPEEKLRQREQQNALNSAHLHGNEIRLLQKLVRARQKRIEGTDAQSEEVPLLVTDANWESFLGRWQAEESSSHTESIAHSIADTSNSAELAPQPVLEKIGTNRSWAANQRWFAFAASIGALVVGLQFIYFQRPPESSIEDDLVMRGDEQAQRIIVADAAEGKAKADEVERLLRDAGVLVRRIEISGGIRIEAKVTASDLKRETSLGEEFKKRGLILPEHGRLVVKWVGK